MNTASHPRMILLIKSATHHDGMFKHSGKYFLLNGRWRKLAPEHKVPKNAPVASHPEAAGKFGGVKLSADQVDQLKYQAAKAASNPEMAAFNEKHLPKLLAHGESGDATALLGMGYGINSHAKKQALVANFLLQQMGSPHKVSPGQKAGEHAGVQGDAAPEPHPSGLPGHLVPRVAEPTKSPEQVADQLLDDAKASAKIPPKFQAVMDAWAASGDFAALSSTAANNAVSNPAIAKYAQKLVNKKQITVPTSTGKTGPNTFPAPPDFADHDAALAWIAQRSKALGMSKQAFSSSYEYAYAMPKMQAAYSVAKQSFDKKQADHGAEVLEQMKSAGVKVGDTVAWTQTGAFLSQTKYEGKVVLKNSVPHVKLAHEVAVTSPGGKISYTKLLPWQPHMKVKGEAVAPAQDVSKNPVGATAAPTAPGIYSSAIDYVLHGGSESDERAALVNLKTGKVIGQHSGVGGNVDALHWDGQGEVGIIHNHPGGGTLSLADIENLFSKDYKEIVAVNEKGTGHFLARRIGSWADFKKTDCYDAVDDLFMDLGGFSSKPQRLLAKEHFRLMAMQKAGLIQYKVGGSDVAHEDALTAFNASLKDAPASAVAAFKVATGFSGAGGVTSPAVADHNPKDGDTKPGADGGALVFKDGRWHKFVDADEHGELLPVLVPVGDGLAMPDFQEGKTSTGVKAYYEKVAEKVMGLAGDAAALGGAASAPAPAAPSADSSGQAAPALKLNIIPWDSFLLPASNVNAASINKKLGAIKAAALAGDVAALESMKFGVNSYNKKLAKVAANVVAVLKDDGGDVALAPEPVQPPAPAVLPTPAAPPAPAQQPVAALDAKLAQIPWDKLLLPSSNSNAPGHNKAVGKIKAMAEAGDQSGLQAFVDGKAGAKQNYAKKQALLAQTALAALAESGPAAAPVPVQAPVPAAQTSKPPTPIGLTSFLYVADEVAGYIASGDKVGLAGVVEHMAPMVSKSARKVMAYAAAGLAYLNGAGAQVSSSTQAVSDLAALGQQKAQAKANSIKAVEAAGYGVQDVPGKGLLFSNYKGGMAQAYHGQTAASKAAQKLFEVGVDAEVIGSSPYFVKIHGAVLGGAKPAASAPSVAATLSLAGKPAYDHLGQTGEKGGDMHSEANKWLAANPGSEESLSEALVSLGYADIAATMDLPAPGADDDDDAPQNGDTNPGAPLGGAAAAFVVNPVPVPTTKKTIIRKDAEYFENTDDGHDKFWSVSVNGSVMKTAWGKNGTSGQTSEKTFSSPMIALVAASKLKKEKKAKGYGYVGKTSHDYEVSAPVVESGPQDGDTKQGADGMLVFKDGHWHKQAEAAHPIDAVPMPDLSGFKNPTLVAQALEKLKAQVKEGGAAALSGTTKKMKAKGKLITTLPNPKPQGGELKIIGYAVTGQGSSFNAVFHYVEALKVAVGKAPAKKTAAVAPALAPTVAPATPAPPAIDAWVQTGPKGGSNPGGRFKDESGVEWYCKFPASEDVARSEVLATKLYALAGMAGQDAKLITRNGKVGIASRWVELKQAASAKHLAKVPGVLDGFAVDAWLCNRDVVGASLDNLLVGADGKAHRVDAGGALEYRATGGLKISIGGPPPFGNSVVEIDKMRDPFWNKEAAAVFGKMTEADIISSAVNVIKISDDAIRFAVSQFGPGDMEHKKKLADTLIARKADILARFPKAAAKAKMATFKVENISAPPNFSNWGDGGKGLSSVEAINDGNNAAAKAAYESAINGNLEALQSATAPIFDKATHQVTGHVLLSQHPSQHVRAYWADLVNEVDLQLNPPQAPEIGTVVMDEDAAVISAKLKPVPSGGAVAAIEKSKKIGDYIVLGQYVGALGVVNPGKDNTVISSDEWKAKTADHYHAAPGAAKQTFSTYVTTSGARALNTALRSGDLAKQVSGKSVQQHLDDFKNLLVDIPLGSTFVRRMGMKGYGSSPNEKKVKELQQFLLSAGAGTVVQEPGFSSTSWSGGNAILGNNDIEWQFTAGAGVKMYPGWLTANKGEGEGLLPPNQRYMIVGATKVGKTVRVQAVLLPTI